MAMAPRALDLLISRAVVADKKQRYNGAMVMAALYNVNNDWERRPQGWDPLDFMPGAESPRSEEDDLKAFVLEVERGEFKPPSSAEVEGFKNRLQAQFRMKVGEA